MTQYIVSARKYRPETFETLIGQDNIAQTLKNSIIRGQLAHAYLFCGPRGVGKTTTARIFAKAINCSNPSPDMEPCGECESCRSFAEGRSYCIHELDAASNNGVDDIKALMDQVRIPPQVGKYSVYIIDEVHMLSQAAFNAFLKTLEEPPGYAIFILATTEKHKILPTILSRCQTYDFNRITVDNIVRQLKDIAQKENVSIDDESLHVIANKADGAMRDALTIFDQTVAFCGAEVHYKDVLKNLNVLDYEYSFSLVDDFLTGSYQKALLTFDEILTKGFNALHFVSALSTHLRDLLVSKGGGMESLLELPDSLKKRYAEQAGRCPLKFLYDALAVTTACETGYKGSLNPRLHIEFALMRLCTLSGALAGQMAATSVQQPAAADIRTQPAQTVAGQPSRTSPGQPAELAGLPSAAPAKQTDTVSSVPAEHTEGKAVAPADMAKPANTGPAAPDSKTPGPPSADEDTTRAEQPLQRRTRASRAGTTVLSVKSMTEEESQKKIVAQESVSSMAELDEDTLHAKWQELSELYSKKPRLANAISSASLEITGEAGEKKVVFKVFNTAQRDWIAEKCLRDMEGNFQKLTGSSIRLEVDVIEDSKIEKVPYMPSEKADFLIQKNDEVKTLVQDLGLDLR